MVYRPDLVVYECPECGFQRIYESGEQPDETCPCCGATDPENSEDE